MIGSQSNLNDLESLKVEIDKAALVAESAIQKAISNDSRIDSIPNIDDMETIVSRRAEITTEDFFSLRDSGIYKVQNGTAMINPNRPPVSNGDGAELYGTLVVYKSEIDGENRSVIEFTSTRGERFYCASNGGNFNGWVEIPSIGVSAIVDVNGFIKKA
jgi:hypothetical protein